MSSQVTKTTYVAYLYSGADYSIVQVDTRDPQQQADDAPESALGFYYYEIVTAIIEIDGEHVETTSAPRNLSKKYYIDARVFHRDDIANVNGVHAVTLVNMRNNDWDYIVFCRTGDEWRFDIEQHELVTTS